MERQQLSHPANLAMASFTCCVVLEQHQSSYLQVRRIEERVVELRTKLLSMPQEYFRVLFFSGRWWKVDNVFQQLASGCTLICIRSEFNKDEKKYPANIFLR